MIISFPDYKLLLIIWMAVAACIFFLLLKVKAPYGRHTSGNWGPLIDNHTGWIIMESPALLVMLYVLFSVAGSKALVVPVMIGFYCFHYFNRSFIFPFRLRTKGKKMPLVIAAMAIIFNLANTFFLGYYFIHFAHYTNSWFGSWQFINGTVLFLTGLFINWKADNILIHLRKGNETHYIIPKGWLFEWISCPNMFGELVEWGGFALLCWNLPAFAFFAWSAANLVPRAMAHHKWYREKFADYPASRKAVIPFIA